MDREQLKQEIKELSIQEFADRFSALARSATVTLSLLDIYIEVYKEVFNEPGKSD